MLAVELLLAFEYTPLAVGGIVIAIILAMGLLVPYLIISITGGGTILEELTHGKLPYAVGGAVVCLVVMGKYIPKNEA